MYKAFLDRLEKHKVDIQRTLGRRLRWQFRVLAKVLEGRNTTYRVWFILSSSVNTDCLLGYFAE